MAINRAYFLFSTYTNLFNRVLNNRLDLDILGAFVEVLRRIERR